LQDKELITLLQEFGGIKNKVVFVLYI